MPSPAPFSNPQNNSPFPALYLYPLNDSFVPKHISLNPPGQRVKIGRQTNAKTSPGERNGYFDSKVLSRQHAEVWEENGKIFIKDVKSSNGTFVNGERLSQEGLESDPFELKTDDNVEFGIDIVGEDNKTIIHHKVAARVACIFNEQQGRVDQQQNQGQYSQSAILPQAGAPPGSSSFNFAPGGPQGQRRPPIPHQGLNGMGGMGASMRAPGKSGLTFDHILSRLQGELTKCRETGQDLQTLSGAMNDIQETLGGSLPPTLPPYPHVLPPVRPPQTEQNGASPPQLHPPAPESAPSGSALSDLQSQLVTTQSSLASHVDKIRALEGVFAEQEAIKEEVRTLRDLVGVLREGSASAAREDHEGEPKGGFDVEEDEGELLDDDDDSDARSVATVMPHALERVDEEDEEEEEGVVDEMPEDDKHGEEHDTFRSASPEHQDIFQEHDEDREQRRAELGRPRTPEPTNMGMSRNLARSSTLRSPLAASSEATPTLSTQLESALVMSSTLQAQHAAAQSTIGLVSAVVTSAPSADRKNDVAEPPSAAESSSLQGQWTSVQEEWAQERDRLQRTRDDWENQMRGMVDERIKAKLTTSAFAPTPRSLSADSAHGSSGGGRRRRRRSASRGRSGSPKGLNGNGHAHSSSSSAGSPVSDDDDAITELALRKGDARVLPTPESSGAGPGFASSSPASPPAEAEKSLRAVNKHKYDENTTMHIQTAIGVLVLSVAAAAVIWRVKPE
ncbi:hypothetical protein B0H14DRAFT_2666979 [Mycena olivaceomarginata]|nr:hypothetical protein B0H14DRAFT_2666979 [Mycena olivaceomarginata]